MCAWKEGLGGPRCVALRRPHKRFRRPHWRLRRRHGPMGDCADSMGGCADPVGGSANPMGGGATPGRRNVSVCACHLTVHVAILAIIARGLWRTVRGRFFAESRARQGPRLGSREAKGCNGPLLPASVDRLRRAIGKPLAAYRRAPCAAQIAQAVVTKSPSVVAARPKHPAMLEMCVLDVFRSAAPPAQLAVRWSMQRAMSMGHPTFAICGVRQHFLRAGGSTTNSTESKHDQAACAADSVFAFGPRLLALSLVRVRPPPGGSPRDRVGSLPISHPGTRYVGVRPTFDGSALPRRRASGRTSPSSVGDIRNCAARCMLRPVRPLRAECLYRICARRDVLPPPRYGRGWSAAAPEDAGRRRRRPNPPPCPHDELPAAHGRGLPALGRPSAGSPSLAGRRAVNPRVTYEGNIDWPFQHPVDATMQPMIFASSTGHRCRSFGRTRRCENARHIVTGPGRLSELRLCAILREVGCSRSCWRRALEAVYDWHGHLARHPDLPPARAAAWRDLRWCIVQQVRAEAGQRRDLRHPSTDWTRRPEMALETDFGDGLQELARARDTWRGSRAEFVRVPGGVVGAMPPPGSRRRPWAAEALDRRCCPPTASHHSVRATGRDAGMMDVGAVERVSRAAAACCFSLLAQLLRLATGPSPVSRPF